MTPTGPSRPVEAWWTTQRSKWLLAAIHVPFLVVAPLVTALGYDGPPGSWWSVAVVAVAIGALQVRHSFASARGGEPKGWPGTLVGLALLVYVPISWSGFDWASMQWMFMASAAMLLRGHLRQALIVAPIVGTGLWAALESAHSGGEIPTDLYFVVFWVVSLSGGAACLYGAARLVRAVDDLFAARAELADLTVQRERRRVSRDLHDLLGQSLSAIALKGDLAMALLSRDKVGAQAEILSLSAVARSALRDVRQIARGGRPVQFLAELSGAVALLEAASIDAAIHIGVDNLPDQIDELFGWVTREGVTNMLRHSQASTCTISVGREYGAIYLEIMNDGATGPIAGGSGLAGLTERAQKLSGWLTARHVNGGWFGLRLDVPEATW